MRRIMQQVALTMAVAIALPVSALAQKPSGLPGNYPNKLIRVIASSAPGSAIDIAARTFTTRLNERWTNVIMENRGGTGVAFELVSKAAPDGYTLMVTSISSYTSAELVQKLPYNVRTRFPAIIQFFGSPYIVTVNNEMPVKTVRDLVTYARANPDRLNFGYTSVGSASQLFGELLMKELGIQMQGVPFKGAGPAYIEQMAGRLHLMAGSSSSAGPLVKAGKIRGIATTGARRTRDQPDLPTVREHIADFDVFSPWVGLVGVEGMHPAILTALNREGNAILALPEVEKLFSADGEVVGGTPEQFRKVIEESLDSTARIVRQAGIKLE